jgi:hypothetical protein
MANNPTTVDKQLIIQFPLQKAKKDLKEMIDQSGGKYLKGTENDGGKRKDSFCFFEDDSDIRT